MTQALPKSISFEEFLLWKPDGGRYELHDGLIIEMQPTGKHEEISGFLVTKLALEFERLNLPYFIPKQALIKAPYCLVEGEYQVNQFRGVDRIESPALPAQS